MDESAFPWQADWYKKLIEKNKGAEASDFVRLYYMEHCMHTDCEIGNSGDHQHIVSYLGALHQGLLLLSDWVEKGTVPPDNSGYTMDGGQVIIPESAIDRKGLQPVVNLSSDGLTRVELAIGATAHFRAEIELPAGSGELEEVVWNFDGNDAFRLSGSFSDTWYLEDGTGRASAETEHVYSRPGTYYAIVRVSSNRTKGDIFTRVQNLAKVRVVVTQ